MSALATTEAPFYDTAMTGAGEPAMLPLDQSPWLELYRWASWLIPRDVPVVDLGCGTGRFAEQVRRRGCGSYHGIDFSPLAVAEAKLYLNGWGRFEVGDLREWEPGDDRPSDAVYVCLETLEHLEDDVDLIRRIPVGHQIVFSVPNYGGEAHLRVFQNASDAWNRYGHLLTFSAWQLIGAGPQNFIHLYRGMRRGDSW